jgi:L-2-hydroxyglutarate oxidase LhgO
MLLFCLPRLSNDGLACRTGSCMEQIDILIIGAGAIGLACAARLAAPGRSLLICEREGVIGSHASSRNSEVMHAGIYYPPGSLKAELCIEGRQRLLDWCERYQVPQRQIGKLLVAVEGAEQERLEQLQSNAQRCGVTSLQPLDSRQLLALEPALNASAGLLSADTGIIDSHAYLLSLLGCAERQGAQLALHSSVEQLQRSSHGWHVEGTSQGERFELEAAVVINAAGLFAQQLARKTADLPAELIPPLHLCQGRYFSYSGRSPFSRLIYPMPEANHAGLGIHATLDLGGQLRFGPDVHYVQQLDYQLDGEQREAFALAIRRYFPALDTQRLQPAYSGIRAKLSGRGEPAADFCIQDSSCHGLPGLINLFGIESPGLTASLAIAEHIAARL